MHVIKPGLDGYPKYLYHPTNTPKLIHTAKDHAALVMADKQWVDRYIHQEFPKTMYHKSIGERTVHDYKEQKGLGAGWRTTPFDAEQLGGEDPVAAENAALKEQLAALLAAQAKA